MSRRPPPALAVAVLAAVLAAAGCGGDDEDEPAGTGASADPPTSTVTVPARTATETEESGARTSPQETERGREPESPEDQPGGAGDEEPARSEVVLTGRGGRIGPVVAKVPPFISIRVILRSGDGKPYVLRFGRRILRAGAGKARASATFDGLRPGRRLVGVALSGKVVVEASAEPGP